jgi:hypothetical protein
LRIRGLNLDGALAVLDICRNHLLRSGRQPAVGAGSRPHSLHRAHHIRLLRQESVSQIRSPLNVSAEQTQRIRKRYQSLNARIPILLSCGVDQLLPAKAAVPLEPLLRFHDLQRIRAGGQYLAQ